MSGYDIDRTLADWFEADAQAAVPADGLDRALQGARARRPRPAWLAGPGSHWGWTATAAGSAVGVRLFPGSGMRRSTAVIVVVALGVLLGGVLLVGARLLESPPLPPRLGQLAYALDGDIFLADWDGQNPVRIADGLPGGKTGCGRAGFKIEGSMWSPDGRYLAYRSGRSQVDCQRPKADTYPTVILSDPTGRVVASFHGVGWIVAWSPDSTRVATWLALYPSTGIGIYGLDGVRQTVLSLPPGKQPPGDYEPVWSPDGRSLLVPLMTWDGLTGIGGEVETWAIPVDGSPPSVVPADDPRSRWASSLSPDGTRIAFVDVAGPSMEPGTRVTAPRLIVASADGSQPRVLASDVAEQWGTYPVWSPTGDRLAFVAGSNWEVQVVDVASGKVTRLARGDVREGVRVIEFSPAGDRILFERYDLEGTTSVLWSVGADGSDLRRLVDGTGTGDWQPLQSDGS